MPNFYLVTSRLLFWKGDLVPVVLGHPVCSYIDNVAALYLGPLALWVRVGVLTVLEDRSGSCELSRKLSFPNSH